MLHNPALDKVVLGLIPEGTTSILDLGCGYGELALFLRIQHGYTGFIDGLDIYKLWLERLDRLYLYNHVIHGDIRALDDIPLEDYDLVICLETVEHVSREEGLAVINVLKNRAKNLIISTPSTSYKNIDVRHRRDKHSTGNLAMQHKSGYTPDDFEGFGVELVNVHYVPWYFLPLYHIRAKLIGGSVVTQNIIAYRVEPT